MSANPKTLKNVMDRSLSDYRLMMGYVLELEHGLMGFFPAIITESKEMVICLDKSLLEKVWNLLPKKKAKVKEILLLVNLKECFGFSIWDERKQNIEPIHILLREEFDELMAKEDKSSFKWTPGLSSLRREEPVHSPFK